ncbi:MAG: hypothetical protein IJ770_00390 [Alphaproteobacteria bacterium]|nr:hypothetical protein [Alphaproteobacteria bacterium]
MAQMKEPATKVTPQTAESFAVIKGVVARANYLQRQHLFMLTIDSSSTAIDGRELRIGERITIKVDCSGIDKLSLLESLTFLAAGDPVEVTMEKHNSHWQITKQIVATPKLGRDADDWLADVEEELKRG